MTFTIPEHPPISAGVTLPYAQYRSADPGLLQRIADTAAERALLYQR